MQIKTKKGHLKNFLFLFVGLGILLGGILLIWASTMKIPDFRAIEDREVVNSTKIYDRTGKILLYDVHQNIKRTSIPFSDMGIYIKNATVAVEDAEFYQHNGVRFTSIIRAFFVNLIRGKFSQGGSTITQQIVKNTILTNEKTISRKLKEIILSLKIDATLSKEEILGIYLNETPYGGTVYGVKEASRMFFNKEPSTLTLAEASYLAAIPKAPTYYSPYGKNKDKLEERKNFVLERMKNLSFITDEEYKAATNEKVIFLPQEPFGIKAPHFVFFVKQYLEEKYGQNAVERGGLKIITTLDYDLQKKAEDIVLKYAKVNEVKFKGKNAALVAIDPKTGQILTMVGSRDYFDNKIDGNFNVALANRQPGSAFKPFVYATAFNMGFTPNTVVFDLPTEFQSTCDPYGKAILPYKQSDCYMPENYDGMFRGPISLRNALAQSVNVPAVKMIYLTGIDNSIKTAREMGITTLTDKNQYGLTLVLGGGEVNLLDMTSAYSVFADNGNRHPYQKILRVEDADGNVLEEYKDAPQTVLPKNTTLMISDVLSDIEAKKPLYGENSPLYFYDRDVAAKTGTTNDYRDAWTVGYTPSLAVGAWAGNNDNTPMEKKASGLIIAPLWAEFMRAALKDKPVERFEKPQDLTDTTKTKPVMRGIWQGDENFFIDKISGKLATIDTPKETVVEKNITNVKSILYWVNKKDPQGPAPENPSNDPQFNHWNIPIQDWWSKNSYKYPITTEASKPTSFDDVHTNNKKPVIQIIEPKLDQIYDPNEKIKVSVSSSGFFPLKKLDIFVNGIYTGTAKTSPFDFYFTPNDLTNIQETNEIKIVAEDVVYNTSEEISEFKILTNTF